VRIKSKVYSAVGQCIYCRGTHDLHREHIIPYSLNGVFVLPKASCSACADVTKRFEAVCAKKMFGPLRVRYGFRRRKKKEKPTSFDIEVQTSSDGQPEFITVPALDHPDVLFFLKFKHTANILYGAPDIDTSVVEGWIRNGQFAGKPGWVVAKFDAFAFARMLAKIGHSLAVAELGLGSFRPLTLDFIFGRANNLSRVVGGSEDEEPSADSLHWLRLRDHFHVEKGGLVQRFVVAQIRLFACWGTPTYHVAVGEMPLSARLIGQAA
jgi:hypothetical protein